MLYMFTDLVEESDVVYVHYLMEESDVGYVH